MKPSKVVSTLVPAASCDSNTCARKPYRPDRITSLTHAMPVILDTSPANIHVEHAGMLPHPHPHPWKHVHRPKAILDATTTAPH